MESAMRDAEENAAYIRRREQSAVQAARWLSELQSEIKRLEDQPGKFDLLRAKFAQKLGYRAFNFYSHQVIFRIHEDIRLVTVHRVHHQSRKPLKPKDL